MNLIRKRLIFLICAVINNMPWKENISVEYIWNKLRKTYPDEFCPRTTSTVEYIRTNWITYHNLDYWFTNNKKPLVDSDLFKKILLPNGELSQLTYSESVARRVICMDETKHPFTTEMERGCSRTISYACNRDGKKERRDTRGSRRTTGVYSINVDGEVLPLLYNLTLLLKIVVILKYTLHGVKVYLRLMETMVWKKKFPFIILFLFVQKEVCMILYSDITLEM